MDFFIKKNSNLPILFMQLTNDSRVDHRAFYKALENSAITFSMKDENGVYKIANKKGGIILKPKLSELSNYDEYYVYYRFNEQDTNKPGKYSGEFNIEFFGLPGDPYFQIGSFKAPIREMLFINVLDSISKSSF